MSSDINFFMEVKDHNGNWQLVKYLENGKFNEEENEVEHYGEEYYKLQYPFQLRKKIYVGKALRDALRTKCFFSKKELPKDITTELLGVMEAKAIFDKNAFSIDYKSHYNWFSLEFLDNLYEERYEMWKRLLKRNIGFENNDTIISKIEDAKNEIINSLTQKGNGEVVLGVDAHIGNEETFDYIEEEMTCYEDTVDYAIGEELEDLMQLRDEIEMLRLFAITYTGDQFIHSENVRLYCFFE